MTPPQKVESLTVVIKYSPRCEECYRAMDAIYKVIDTRKHEHTKIIAHIDNIQTFAIEQIEKVRQAHKTYHDNRQQLEKLVENL